MPAEASTAQCFSRRETQRAVDRLLSAVGELGEDLHGQGVINLEDLRLSIQTRRIEAKRMAEVERKSVGKLPKNSASLRPKSNET
jgi:hypothetical protein